MNEACSKERHTPQKDYEVKNCLYGKEVFCTHLEEVKLNWPFSCYIKSWVLKNMAC